MKLLFFKARSWAARETVRFKTDFLFAKTKSRVVFFYSNCICGVLLLDHTLYDLGSHSIPNCKLSLGPVTFFT